MLNWLFRQAKKGTRTKAGFKEKEEAIDHKHAAAASAIKKMTVMEPKYDRRDPIVMPNFLPERRGA